MAGSERHPTSGVRASRGGAEALARPREVHYEVSSRRLGDLAERRRGRLVVAAFEARNDRGCGPHATRELRLGQFQLNSEADDLPRDSLGKGETFHGSPVLGISRGLLRHRSDMLASDRAELLIGHGDTLAKKRNLCECHPSVTERRGQRLGVAEGWGSFVPQSPSNDAEPSRSQTPALWRNAFRRCGGGPADYASADTVLGIAPSRGGTAAPEVAPRFASCEGTVVAGHRLEDR